MKARFAERFEATPGAIAPLFVPLWTLWFRDESGKRRREQIDAILGKPVRWLPPG